LGLPPGDKWLPWGFPLGDNWLPWGCVFGIVLDIIRISSTLNAWVPLLTIDISCSIGRGDAHKKVLVSDWYPEGTEGTPYKNVSGVWENMDDHLDIFKGG